MPYIALIVVLVIDFADRVTLSYVSGAIAPRGFFNSDDLLPFFILERPGFRDDRVECFDDGRKAGFDDETSLCFC